MNSVRFIAATVVAWLIFTIGGTVWHEVVFATWYNDWVFGIERLEMPISYFLITYFMRALVFVYVYHMLYKSGNPVLKGLKFGFLMGILTGLTVTSYYGTFEIASPKWAMLEFAYSVVRDIIIGIIMALIIGERKQDPAT